LLVVIFMDDAINNLTKRIIGCAIEVHRALGPGLQERTYENALAIELRDEGLPFDRQVSVPVAYKGEWIGDYRLDLIVDDAVVVEIKSVERGDPPLRSSVARVSQSQRQAHRPADQLQLAPVEPGRQALCRLTSEHSTSPRRSPRGSGEQATRE
jgi:GxxExxY protein